jgi:hypothetical protein
VRGTELKNTGIAFQNDREPSAGRANTVLAPGKARRTVAVLRRRFVRHTTGNPRDRRTSIHILDRCPAHSRSGVSASGSGGVCQQGGHTGSGLSLTTSAVSRDTLPVQVAGADSHKPKSRQRRPWLVVARRDRVSTLKRSICVTASERRCPPNISSATTDHDDSCELPPFEGGGSPNQFAGHSRPLTTQASPHRRRR